LFIKQASETSRITAVDETTETEGSHHSLIGKVIPKGVMIYQMFGAFFFGAADKLESALQRLKQEPEIFDPANAESDGDGCDRLECSGSSF